jgi:ParB family chromosome partitioning protein
MQGDVESGALTTGHAKAILGVTSPERRRTLRDRIVRDSLSVRQTEELARELGAATRTRANGRAKLQVLDPDLANLVDLLRSRLQTQVRLRGSASRGRIEIDYVGGDELGRLVDRILGEP